MTWAMNENPEYEYEKNIPLKCEVVIVFVASSTLAVGKAVDIWWPLLYVKSDM